VSRPSAEADIEELSADELVEVEPVDDVAAEAEEAADLTATVAAGVSLYKKPTTPLLERWSRGSRGRASARLRQTRRISWRASR